MTFSYGQVEVILGYKFKNADLLKKAFTHASYSNEHDVANNERLEFLGDSVLGFIVADYLYSDKAGLNEGEMTKEKQNIVSSCPLSDVIEELGLSRFLLVGESVDKNKLPKSVLENLCESIIAAIYLDGGIEEAKRFVFEKLLSRHKKNEDVSDCKSALQEYAQAKKMGTPKYELVSRTGPDHNPQFTISVSIGGKIISVGSGKNKSEASQSAARRALKKITGRKK